MSKIVVIIGAPGAGKGTQARLVSEKYGYPQISTGDILREMALADTPLGNEIRSVQAAGKLVSDEILAQVIRERTSQPDCENGYILDGYPRTISQAHQLEELAAQQGKDVLFVRIYVQEEALMKRLTGRWSCKKCGEIYNIELRPPRRDGFCDRDGEPLWHRDDDNPTSVARRFTAYRASTTPLIEYYRENGSLIQINGDQPVADVFAELSAVIDGASEK